MWQGMVSARSPFVWDFCRLPGMVLKRRRWAFYLFLADRRVHESCDG